MTRREFVCIALLLTLAVVAVPGASAATTCRGTLGSGDSNCVHFVAAGSSSMWQGTLMAVYNDIMMPVAKDSAGAITAHHWTIRSNSDTACTPCASIEDPRVNPVQTDAGDVWVAWLSNAADTEIYDVWAYYSVDSAQGDRAFLSRSGAHTSAVVGLIGGDNQAGANAVNAALFADDSTDFAAGLTTVANLTSLVSNAEITAAFTDIRAEDALYANERACSSLDTTNWTGLGYSTSRTCGSSFAGTPIESAYSTTSVTPIAFQLPGFADPINTAYTVPTTIITINVGESPIVYIVNRSNTTTGLGQGWSATTTSLGTTMVGTTVVNVTGSVGTTGLYANLIDGYVSTTNPVGNLYSGYDCAGDNPAWTKADGKTASGGGTFPINLLERESLSGGYNTNEFTVIRAYGSATGTSLTTTIPTTSQDANIGAPTEKGNPLNLPCVALTSGGTTGGNRLRAVSTSELITQLKCGGSRTGSCASNAPAFSYNDTLGYAFFSFGNVSTLALNANYGYVTLDDVDPIFTNYNWTDAAAANPDVGQPVGGTSQWFKNAKGYPFPYPPGTLPLCIVGATAYSTSAPACTQAAIWNNGNSFPNLRNGTYRAWSILRALCDPLELEDGNDECLSGSGTDAFGDPIDPGSAGNVIASAEADIDNNVGVPDFLPFKDAPLVRAHFAYKTGVSSAPFDAPASHTSPVVKFYDLAATPPVKNVPVDIIAGSEDYGGDVGGCIEDAKTGGITITTVVSAKKLTFVQNDDASPLKAGDVITFAGFEGTLAPNNTTFQVTKILPGAELKLNAALNPAPPAGIIDGVTASITQCAQ